MSRHWLTTKIKWNIIYIICGPYKQLTFFRNQEMGFTLRAFIKKI